MTSELEDDEYPVLCPQCLEEMGLLDHYDYSESFELRCYECGLLFFGKED